MQNTDLSLSDHPPAHPRTQREIYLKDYRPPAYWADHVDLTFHLHPTKTRVISKIKFRPNTQSPGPFFLNGENVTLIWAKIDGGDIGVTYTDGGLTCDVPDKAFIWEAEVEINPQGNTALEGLYISNNMYCTQCEAQGFRKITYYPDRPDVMAPFDVHIHCDLPVRLSNGNAINDQENHQNGVSHWHDPWPKPSYLFALVAGELVAHTDTFTTQNNNVVDLNIWVHPRDKDKCAFAMDALKRSMVWDEKVYGRVYDLDVFNIVAVDDFNMGAMENKGLNIFNASAVLCDPQITTDASFERIEAIIAHEYFHNWTGNRITCRDWFQLCLKEGLTVFRDQQFTADERARDVARINDVIALRQRQFREDNSPLAHAVRPESFVEINNFYTATVYEKGAEVIRMLRTIVGDCAYNKALTLYFDRHDGQACTIEQWLKVFEDVTGHDLTHFKRWYSQAGTPRVQVADDYKDGTYTLHFRQHTAPTPKQDEKTPLVIPIAYGLIGQDGSEIQPTDIFILDQPSAKVQITGLTQRPIPSLLRGFSAPVILEHDVPAQDYAHLLAYDSDAFCRWEAARNLTQKSLLSMIKDGADIDQVYLKAIDIALRKPTTPAALRAQFLYSPTQDDIAQMVFETGATPDPDHINTTAQKFLNQRANALQETAHDLYNHHQVQDPFLPNAHQAGQRALGNACLALITRTDGGRTAQHQFDTAGNMTQSYAALAALVQAGQGDDALGAFYDRWRHERLVIDRWFSVQSSFAPADKAVDIVNTLSAHRDFSLKNPNRFRALFSGFAYNSAGFHRADGAGYKLMGHWLIQLDKLNPQAAARMVSVFETWRRYDDHRQTIICQTLENISQHDNISSDMAEMTNRIIGARG